MGVAIAYMRDRFTADKLVAEKVSDFISRPQEAPPGYDPSQPPQTRPAFDRKKNAAPLGLLAMLTSEETKFLSHDLLANILYKLQTIFLHRPLYLGLAVCGAGDQT